MASCTLGTGVPPPARISVVHDLPNSSGPNTSVCGQDDDEPRAGSLAQGEAAAVPDDDLPGYRQAQARAATVGRAGVIEPGEPLEHRLAGRRGDPRTVVGDGE